MSRNYVRLDSEPISAWDNCVKHFFRPIYKRIDRWYGVTGSQYPEMGLLWF